MSTVRQESMAQGLTRYFTGRPCCRGHVAARLVSTGTCTECARTATAAYAASHPDKVRAWNAAYSAAHREKRRAYSAAYYAAHREKRRGYSAAYRAMHPDKVRAADAAYRASHPEQGRAQSAAYRASHPEKMRTYNANRRAMKRDQLCACCMAAQMADEFYAWSGGAEVDHVVALKVAELLQLRNTHCRQNLRLFTTIDHRLKTAANRKLIANLRREPDAMRRREIALAHYGEHEPRAADFIRGAF